MTTTHHRAPKTFIRKLGIPVKRFWSERVTAVRRKEQYITTYPIYFYTRGEDKVHVLKADKAPRSYTEAVRIARMMVESPDDPYTYAMIYKMEIVHRVGTEFDWKTHEQEQRKKG